MKFIRLYVRVLELLGREARLGWVLAIANLAIASAMFVEPILFGRIIDPGERAGPAAQLNWPN
jgi:ATP-binding cassette subfamily B protein